MAEATARAALRVYVGWDQRDAAAFEVCAHTLESRASVPIEVIALKDWELRAKGVFFRPYRVDEDGQMWDGRDGKPFSTNFSYTRFCVPLLEEFGDEPVVFCDGDMLWREDVAELVPWLGEAAVACVMHEHTPAESIKMTGNVQRPYPRKNWSSLMVMRPRKCAGLTRYAVNNMDHDWLHGFCWVGHPDDIADIPEEWNWLCGWSSPELDPRIVHFTRGTPDMAGHEDEPYADEWRHALTESRGAAKR